MLKFNSIKIITITKNCVYMLRNFVFVQQKIKNEFKVKNEKIEICLAK